MLLFKYIELNESKLKMKHITQQDRIHYFITQVRQHQK